MHLYSEQELYLGVLTDLQGHCSASPTTPLRANSIMNSKAPQWIYMGLIHPEIVPVCTAGHCCVHLLGYVNTEGSLDGQREELGECCSSHMQGCPIQRKCRDKGAQLRYTQGCPTQKGYRLVGCNCMRISCCPTQRKWETCKMLWCTHIRMPYPEKVQN